MSRGRSRRVVLERLDAGGTGPAPAELIVEEPMEIRLDGSTVTTVMRTPGHDYELAVGHLHAAGLLAGAPVQTVRYCGTGSAVETGFNVVSVETGAELPVGQPPGGRASCSWSGADRIDDLAITCPPLPPHRPVDPVVLAGLPVAVDRRRSLNRATGAGHAAAVFTASGDVRAVREDVGADAAVHKAVGRLVLDGSPAPAGGGLFIAGRPGFDVVAAAWRAGITTVAATDAPTTMAVEAATRAGIALIVIRGEVQETYVDPAAS